MNSISMLNDDHNKNLLYKVNSYLKCLHCNERYDNPRELKRCGHVVCLSCINRLVDKENHCPICLVGPIQAEKINLIDEIFSAVDRFNNYIDEIKKKSLDSCKNDEGSDKIANDNSIKKSTEPVTIDHADTASDNSSKKSTESATIDHEHIKNLDLVISVKKVSEECNYDSASINQHDEEYDTDEDLEDKIIVLDTYRDNNDIVSYHDNSSYPHNSSLQYNDYNSQLDMVPDTYRDADYLHEDNRNINDNHTRQESIYDNYNNYVNDDKKSSKHITEISKFGIESCPEIFETDNFIGTNRKKRKFNIAVESSSDEDDDDANNVHDQNNETGGTTHAGNQMLECQIDHIDDGSSRDSTNSNDCSVASPILLNRSILTGINDSIEILPMKNNQSSNDSDKTYRQQDEILSPKLSLESTQPPDDMREENVPDSTCDEKDLDLDHLNVPNVDDDHQNMESVLAEAVKFDDIKYNDDTGTPFKFTINYNNTSQTASSAPENQNNTIQEALNAINAARILKLSNGAMYTESSNLEKDGDGMKWYVACKRLGLIKDIQYKAIEKNGMDDNKNEILIMEGITIENKVYVKRTLKYLIALCKGIWIVNSSWLRDCLNQKKLILPDDYEIIGTEDDTITSAPKKARSRAKYQNMKLFSRYSFSVSEAKELEGEKSSKLKKDDAITLIKLCGGTISDENMDSNGTNDNCIRSHIRLSNQLKKPAKIDKQMMQGTQMSCNSYSTNSGNNDLVYTNKLLSINFLIDAICNQQVPYNFCPYELRS